MQNLIVEFDMPSGISHTCVINRDAMRDKYPMEAKFAKAMDDAMESPEKSAIITREMFDANFLKTADFPCEVVDHIVLTVKD